MSTPKKNRPIGKKNEVSTENNDYGSKYTTPFVPKSVSKALRDMSQGKSSYKQLQGSQFKFGYELYVLTKAFIEYVNNYFGIDDIEFYSKDVELNNPLFYNDHSIEALHEIATPLCIGCERFAIMHIGEPRMHAIMLTFPPEYGRRIPFDLEIINRIESGEYTGFDFEHNDYMQVRENRYCAFKKLPSCRLLSYSKKPPSLLESGTVCIPITSRSKYEVSILHKNKRAPWRDAVQFTWNDVTRNCTLNCFFFGTLIQRSAITAAGVNASSCYCAVITLIEIFAHTRNCARIQLQDASYGIQTNETRRAVFTMPRLTGFRSMTCQEGAYSKYGFETDLRRIPQDKITCYLAFLMRPPDLFKDLVVSNVIHDLKEEEHGILTSYANELVVSVGLEMKEMFQQSVERASDALALSELSDDEFFMNNLIEHDMFEMLEDLIGESSDK